jgi:hypothetical protein
MKTLTIYISNSFFKYEGIYGEHRYEVTELKHLQIFKCDKYSGEENLVSYFKNWDYFIIEETND